jgi:hypothetical protein
MDAADGSGVGRDGVPGDGVGLELDLNRACGSDTHRP